MVLGWDTSSKPNKTWNCPNEAQLTAHSQKFRAKAIKFKKRFPSRRSKFFAASCSNLLIHQWPFFVSHSEIRAHRSWMTMEPFDFRRRSRNKERRWTSSLIPKYSSLFTDAHFHFPTFFPRNSLLLIHHFLSPFLALYGFCFHITFHFPVLVLDVYRIFANHAFDFISSVIIRNFFVWFWFTEDWRVVLIWELRILGY